MAYVNPSYQRSDSSAVTNSTSGISEPDRSQGWPPPIVIQPKNLHICGLTHGEFNSHRGARTSAWIISVSSVVVIGCCIALGVNGAPVGWSAAIGVVYLVASILCHLSCWYKLTLCITLATIGVLLCAAVGVVQVAWAVIAIVEYTEVEPERLSKTTKVVLTANIMLGLVAIATITSAIVFSIKGFKVLFSHKDKRSHVKYRATPRYPAGAVKENSLNRVN